MKYKILFTVLICLYSIQLFSQEPSKKMMELKEICLSLRDNIGSDDILYQTNKRFKDFRNKNSFTSDLSPLNFNIVSGEENLLPLDNHIIFIPEYFDELLKNDGSFKKAEELMREWEEMNNVSRRGSSGYVFYQHNFVLKKHSSMVFEVQVPSGPVDFMVVSEPNSLTTMHIYDIVNKEYYNELDSDKEGRKYRHRTMRMRSPSKLKITIYNRSAKDASMVFFYF